MRDLLVLRCCAGQWKEAVLLSKSQTKGVNGLVKYLLLGMELETNTFWFQISVLCFFLSFSSFLFLLFFQKNHQNNILKRWSAGQRSLWDCLYANTDVTVMTFEWFMTTEGWVFIHSFGQLYSTVILPKCLFCTVWVMRMQWTMHFFALKKLLCLRFLSVFSLWYQVWISD